MVLERLRNDRRASIDPPRSGTGSSTCREIDETVLAGIQALATIGTNRNGMPTLAGKIKIELAGMLSDAGMDYPLAIKLRAL